MSAGPQASESLWALPRWARVFWIVPLLTLATLGIERDREAVHAAASGSEPAAQPALAQALGLQQGGAAERERERLLQRWNALTDEQRTALEERYERFRTLDPMERELLVQGGRRLDALAQDIERGLTPGDLARLDLLGPEERRTELRIMAAETARELGQVVLERLPEGQRQRFEGATLSDRLRFITRFRQQQEKQLGSVLTDLAGLMHLGEEGRKALAGMPPELARQRLLDMLRTYAEREAESLEGQRRIPEQTWRRLSQMRGREFMRSMLRLRTAHPELWPHLGPEPDAFDPDRERLRLRVRMALGPLPGEHIRALELSPEEREVFKRRLRRERILQILRQENAFSDTELAELERLPPVVFLRAMRRLTRREGGWGRPLEDLSDLRGKGR